MTKQIKVLTPSKDERIFSREAVDKMLSQVNDNPKAIHVQYIPKEGSEDFTYMLLLNPKLSSGKVLRAYVTDEEEFTVDVLPRENANGNLLRRAVDQGRKLEYSLKGKYAGLRIENDVWYVSEFILETVVIQEM